MQALEASQQAAASLRLPDFDYEAQRAAARSSGTPGGSQGGYVGPNQVVWHGVHQLGNQQQLWIIGLPQQLPAAAVAALSRANFIEQEAGSMRVSFACMGVVRAVGQTDACPVDCKHTC